MMSVQELFYGVAEPVWIINTAGGQAIRHFAQPKPDQYTSEPRNLQPKAPPQTNFHQLAPHTDSPAAQMGYPYHQLRQSPQHQSIQHQAPQHGQHNSIPQKTLSQQRTDQDRQYINQIDQQRQHAGPLQQIPQPYHPLNNHSGPPQNPSYLISTHQPSAPPLNALFYNHQQENVGHYTRPETQVVRLRVPMCCEACEERVMVSLSAIRGVQSVECAHRKEKVTVTGRAAPADILKACKKLFKRSEMWVDRYY